MTRPAPAEDINEDDLRSVHRRRGCRCESGDGGAGGGQSQAGVARTVRSMLRVNQHDGFDCPGCAWPEPARAAAAARSSARTAPRRSPRRATTAHASTPDFFAAHPVAELASAADYWLGQQGRLTEPMVTAPEGATTTSRSAGTTRSTCRRASCARWPRPDRAVFYTSGRTSNEAAFLYQLFARAFGTNNLPDCSNMCHESTGAALHRDHRHRQGHGLPGRHPRAPT